MGVVAPSPEERRTTGTTILAIGRGKYKCVGCTYDTATAAAVYRTITASRAVVERLVRTTRPAVVMIEVCTTAEWSDLARARGVPAEAARVQWPLGQH